MSQLILDEQLDHHRTLAILRRWIKADKIEGLRPGEAILDERVPEILLTLKQPTFVTIDQDFWRREFCHPGYCILYFALRDEEQRDIPALLRALFKEAGFGTRQSRMGKVVRVSRTRIDCYEFSKSKAIRILWSPIRKRKP